MSIVTQGFGGECSITIMGWGLFEVPLPAFIDGLIPLISDALHVIPITSEQTPKNEPIVTWSAFLSPSILDTHDGASPKIELTHDLTPLIAGNHSGNPLEISLVNLKPVLSGGKNSPFTSMPSQDVPVLISSSQETTPKPQKLLDLKPAFKK